MRHAVVTAFLLVLILFDISPVSAQSTQRTSASVRRIDLPASFREEAEARREAGPLLRASTLPGRVLTALGAAALGAGVGFFASQVVQGDWDDGRREVDRPTWAAIGGSIGFAVGFTFPVGGRGIRPDPSRTLPRGRSRIGGEEIRGRGVKTAREAVELLRPEWLRGRGTHVIGENSEQTLQVYLDDVRLGGVRFLADVPAQTIRSIHFFDAAAATLRWGAGHSHGVILIIAEGGMPTGSTSPAAHTREPSP